MILANDISGKEEIDIGDLEVELLQAMGEPVEVFPGIAMAGYVEEGLIICEDLFYEDLASLVRWISYYELIDYVVILNPEDEQAVLRNGGRNLITYQKENLYVFTFSRDPLMANKMIKYYTFAFEMGGNKT